ncbi:YbaN family protein [Mesobacillus foraminis]|uniref:YbaN family protein n=1 Tax=Mesobacillus foraminis TaxID=279826 RepID=UPI001BEBA678|nr:YbaN family protein [Mesobacillus foraminis]MBT2758433.1 YbaN family protein [Mesobacillus foraminis]
MVIPAFKEAPIIKKVIKLLYIAAGFLFLGLGIVGILLPVLPTTPLLLLASFFFVKGSERFEVWFKGTSIYKKHLEGFLRERAMTLRQKISLNLFADAMIALAIFTVDILAVRLILLVIVIYKYYYFAAKIKTVKQTQQG